MNSNDVLRWLRDGVDTREQKSREKLSTQSLGRARLYKANDGPPRQPRAKRKGTTVVFSKGINLAQAMGTRYSFVPR